MQQVRAAELAAAAREARLQEQNQEQAESAIRHAAQALQTLRAQLMASHTEAVLQVRNPGTVRRWCLVHANKKMCPQECKEVSDGNDAIIERHHHEKRSLCPTPVQERRKHDEERSELLSRLTLAEAKVQQTQALQTELVTAREEIVSLKVSPIQPLAYRSPSIPVTC